jgi:hypothetical protein
MKNEIFRLQLNFFFVWLYSPCGPWPLFQFLNLYTVGKAPWTGEQPIARPLPAHRINAQTSMPRVGFERTIAAFERVKTVHALDRTATVTVLQLSTCFKRHMVFRSKRAFRLC